MKISRRNVIKNMALGSTAIVAAPAISFAKKLEEKVPGKLKGNINHSVCRWILSDHSLDDVCEIVKKIGFGAIDLLKPNEWATVQKHGVYCSMCYTAGDFTNNLYHGFAHTDQHEQLIKDYAEAIPLVAKAGYKDVICFSGTRNGMDDETGFKNCVTGLQQILPLAEKNGITMHMELLNSKIDHKDYMCDHSAWGVELCKRVGSPNFKLLYDIYHMQIDEGDIIRTINDNHEYFGHYHTGGVPGRHEIDDTQELHYPAIMRAIVASGFKGYVAQEFMPTWKDKAASLKEAIQICDV
ncbi:MAG TPA: TIM barrel protein [Parafilimonas sp.]|nr:TIM barrel protein [Parafilimonas sp.]